MKIGNGNPLPWLIRNNLTATTSVIERAIFNDNECLDVGEGSYIITSINAGRG
jgi:hypothetical protein